MSNNAKLQQKLKAHRLEQAAQIMKPARVLLAEDNSEIRCRLASALRKDGYQVLEAEDIQQAFRHLHLWQKNRATEEAVDLIISDMGSERQKSLAMLTALRQRDWAIPFIVVAPDGDPETRREARRLGAAAVFRRPFDMDDMRTAVLYLAPLN